MTEDDLNGAHALLTRKCHMEEALDAVAKDAGRTLVVIRGVSTIIRPIVMKEMLEKEIKYVNREMKILGITEIS